MLFHELRDLVLFLLLVASIMRMLTRWLLPEPSATFTMVLLFCGLQSITPEKYINFYVVY